MCQSAKMDPSAANIAVAVWNGCARDARRHTLYQWVYDMFSVSFIKNKIKKLIIFGYNIKMIF